MKKIALFLIFVLSINTGSAQKKTKEIDSLMNLFKQNAHFNGTILVAENNQVIYKNGFGYANMEWNVPNTTNTRFRLASLGKQFTALLIMQLVEEGKIKLEGKICDYLPEYPATSGKIITIHQLLTHTSGIPNYHIIPDYDANQGRAYTRSEYMDLFKNQKLMFKPGTQYYYTNLGYFVLGCIAEKVSGKSYTQLIKQKIFDPAGMTESNTEEEKQVIPNLAYGYNFIYTGYEPARFRHPSQVFGAGHIITTVEDFFKYDQALHNYKLLSEKYQKLTNTVYKNGYGYGWNMSYYPKSKNDSVTLASHDGGTYGFASVAYRFIEDNKLIVAFSNSSPYDMYVVARAVGRILYNREKIFPKRSYVEEFAITTNKANADSAVGQYYYLKKSI
ncbi:MAG: beta-lactamase family protein [Sphingobacteriaceae bacterium]|nr:beta-lactamase family protein [Sphingobacteriaceae bacterium]